MPAVNLFKTEFTSTISVLHLHAGTGRYGGSGGSGGLYLMKNKGKQLQYNLEIDLQAELSFVKIIFL